MAIYTDNRYKNYKMLSRPTRDNPYYSVQGPGGRNDVRNIPAEYFDITRVRKGAAGRRGETPIDEGAIREIERSEGIKVNPGVLPEKRKKFDPTKVERKEKPYSLLPGLETPRVKRMTLLRGM